MTFTSKLFKSLLTGAAATLFAVQGMTATLDVGGVKVEDTLTIYNNTLLLNGAGVFSNGKNPTYVAHIYARQKFTTLDELAAAPGPKRLILTAIREVDTAPIMKQFNRSVEVTANKNDMAKLVPGLMSIGNIFKTHRVLRPGEVMTLDWVPISGLIIYVGGKLQGEPYRQPELFRAAMGVWMGDAPADAKLKQALLGHI